jgi:hypothetical protein
VYCNYYQLPTAHTKLSTLDSNLHSPQRRLIELRMEHADLNASIDRLAIPICDMPIDELLLRRLKKRRLALRDQITQLEVSLDGKEPA